MSEPGEPDEAAVPRPRLLEGRVVVVTGAGRGLGRSHALELAGEGALVVVNDLGVSTEGMGPSPEPARLVAETIRAFGGSALESDEDVSDFAGAGRLIEATLASFGRIDAVVNNAGVARDEPFVSLSPENFEAVMRVHVLGHVAVSSMAAAHWRALAMSEGPSDWRIVNTTAPAALFGATGKSAFAAAKGAIAALTLSTSEELSRYGVTVNAIAPAARTRQSEAEDAAAVAEPSEAGAFDAMDPRNVSPLVAWLCSAESRGISGRVFEVAGGRVSLVQGWRRLASFDRGDRLLASQLRPVIEGLIAQAS